MGTNSLRENEHGTIGEFLFECRELSISIVEFINLSRNFLVPSAFVYGVGKTIGILWL